MHGATSEENSCSSILKTEQKNEHFTLQYPCFLVRSKKKTPEIIKIVNPFMFYFYLKSFFKHDYERKSTFCLNTLI